MTSLAVPATSIVRPLSGARAFLAETHTRRRPPCIARAGNRISPRRRDGTILTYQYDALNRVTVKTVPASATGGAGYSVHYGHDVGGRQLYARFGSTSGAGLINTYDSLGRLTSTSNNMSGTARTLSNLYDPGGRRGSLSFPESYSFGYTYDAAGRLTSILKNNNPFAVAASFTYDAAGRPAGWAVGTAATAYGYDPVSRLQSLGHDLAATTADQTLTFSYNPASQITARTSANTAYAWTDAANVSRAYAPNGLNQYTAVGGATYGYDANGNLISDPGLASGTSGATTFVYDAENRLVSASGARNATLAYDPLGRLWQVAGGGNTTQFLYDGDELVAEYNGAGTVLRRYAHGLGSDDPVLWYEGADLSVRRSLHADQQGSIVAFADASGTVSAINAYDPWGVPNSTNQGRFQYTGQAWLPELGLYHYKARIYSPTLGRFLQTDPIGYEDQVNLYAYVGNNPVNLIDPDGQEHPCVYGPSRCANMGQPWVENFLRGVFSYGRDLAIEIRHVVRLTGLLGAEAQNRARLVDALGSRAISWAVRNPNLALQIGWNFVTNNVSFLAGRSLMGLAVGSRTPPGAGLALGAAAGTGGVVRALNNTAGALQGAGLDPNRMSDRNIFAVAAAGAMGANVGFNARTGDVTASYERMETGSRIPRTETVVICNVERNCVP